MSDKTDFLEKQKASLDAWAHQLQHLHLQAENMPAGGSAKIENHLAELQDKVDAAKKNFADMLHEPEGSWEDIMFRVAKTWEELREILDKMNAQLE